MMSCIGVFHSVAHFLDCFSYNFRDYVKVQSLYEKPRSSGTPVWLKINTLIVCESLEITSHATCYPFSAFLVMSILTTTLTICKALKWHTEKFL